MAARGALTAAQLLEAAPAERRAALRARLLASGVDPGRARRRTRASRSPAPPIQRRGAPAPAARARLSAAADGGTRRRLPRPTPAGGARAARRRAPVRARSVARRAARETVAATPGAARGLGWRVVGATLMLVLLYLVVSRPQLARLGADGTSSVLRRVVLPVDPLKAPQRAPLRGQGAQTTPTRPPLSLRPSGATVPPVSTT